jgi:hypothetical protein
MRRETRASGGKPFGKGLSENFQKGLAVALLQK